MRLRALCLLLLLGVTGAAPAQVRLLVISGIGGEAEYSRRFRDWSLSMLDAARDHLGLTGGQVLWLCESPGRDGGRCAGESRRERVLATLESLEAGGDTPLMVLLVGHGTWRDGRALFNLPGPDLPAAELARALERLGDRPLAVVNTAPASSPFVAALSRPGRVVITATARTAENDHTRFAGHFAAAFSEGVADADKDRRVSLLEAFRFTVAQLEQEYRRRRQVITEHALLDDNGDGDGARRPQADTGDGAAAARFFLAEAPASLPDSPRRRALEAQARVLLAEIADLRRRRAALPPDRYLDTLEALLVGLALNRRALRAAHQ